jgi:hypothetical protein
MGCYNNQQIVDNLSSLTQNHHIYLLGQFSLKTSTQKTTIQHYQTLVPNNFLILKKKNQTETWWIFFNEKNMKNQPLKFFKTTQHSSKPKFIIFHGNTLEKIHTSSLSLVWSL